MSIDPQWSAFQTAVASNLRVLPSSWLERASHVTSLQELQPPEDKALPAIQLRALGSLIRRYRRWKKDLEEAADLQALIPPSVWTGLQAPDQIAALRRLQRFLAIPGLDVTEAIWQAGLQLWDGCFRLAWKEAIWQTSAPDLRHPRLDHFADLVGKKEKAEEIPPHRWLAIERGLQEGVLSLAFLWPEDKLLSQVEIHRKPLAAFVGERSSRSILQEIVLDDLPAWMKRKIRDHTQDSVTQTACQEYRELLLAPPWQQGRLAAIYIGHPRSPLAAVWLSSQGEIEASQTFEAERPWLEDLRKALHDRPPQALALPLRSADSERLNLLIREFSKPYTIFRVKEAGISVAREAYLDPRGKKEPMIASALALAARLREPFRAWGEIDPLHLGLADYQDQLDTERLRESLLDEKTIAAWTPEQAPTALRPGLQTSSGRFNPLLRSLDDLKPGMVLQGMISHLTDFGAFVHLGLPEEGLIHLSELADRFVRHPSEVVRAGQTLQARVLAVDREKRTISLSLRSQASGRSTQQTRAKQLQALDGLFKKK